MALGVHWSLKNTSLLVGIFIFLLIYLTSRHTNPNSLLDDNAVPGWAPSQPMHHKLDWDLPDTYNPPAPAPRPPKPKPISWAEAKFAHDAEEAAKRRKEEHEKKVLESPEHKQKAEEILKKVAAEQQRALAEQQQLAQVVQEGRRLPFQLDLKLELPQMDTKHLRRYNPHNWQGPGRGTIATYFTSPTPLTLQDPYFLSIVQLAYRILWDPRTKSTHTFTVFVAPHIPQSHRDIFSALGCLVKQLDPVEDSPIKEESQKKWQFAKLHLWSQFDFARILFLDADAFPFQPIDPLLDLPQLGCKRELLPMEDAPLADILCQYSFNVAPQGFQQPNEQSVAELNVGVMLLQPNDSMQKRLLRGLKSFTGDSLQGYLSEMFRNDGPFPWEGLDRSWNGFFPQENEEHSLKIVHEKLWMEMDGFRDGIRWAKHDFAETHQAMVRFFGGEVFVGMREKDGVRSFE